MCHPQSLRFSLEWPASGSQQRPHLDFEMLKWSNIVEIWGTQNETKNNLQLSVCTSLADSYTAHHKQRQPAKLRNAPDGVCEGVGCAIHQSQTAQNDSRGVFMNSKLRSSSVTPPENSRSIPFHAREPSRMVVSPMKKRL